MDVGTEPYETGLIKFIEALQSNKNIGGVSGFMTLDINVQSSESQMKQVKNGKASFDHKTYPIE